MNGFSPKSLLLSIEYVIVIVLPSNTASLIVTLTPLLSRHIQLSRKLFIIFIYPVLPLSKIGICPLLLVVLQRMGNPMPSMATDTPTKIDAAATPFFQVFIFFFVRIDCFTLRFTFSFQFQKPQFLLVLFIYINII